MKSKNDENRNHLLSLIFDSISDLISIIDINGKRISVNRSLQLLLGKEKMIDGSSFLTEVHPDDKNTVEKAFKNILKTKKQIHVTYRIILSKNNIRNLDTILTPVNSRDGELEKIISISRDVTEKYESDNQIRLLAHAVSCTKDSFILTDLKNNLLFVNPATSKMYGYTDDELIGKNIDLIISPKNRSSITDEIDRSTFNGGWNGELIHRRKDGTELPVEMWTSVVPDDKGNVVAIEWISRDITKRSDVQEQLRETAARLQLMMDNLNILAFELDSEGKFILSRGRGLNQINLRPDELLGKSAYELYQNNIELKTMLDKALAGENVQVDLELGGYIWNTNLLPLKDKNEKVIKIFGTAIDVTARKTAEDALRSESELLHSLMDTIPDTIYFKDTESRFTRINKAQAEVLGLVNVEDAIGKTDADYFIEEHAAITRKDEISVIRDGKKTLGKLEKIILKSGKLHWFTTSKVPLRDKTGKIIGLVGSSRDITNLKQAEDIELALYRIAEEAHSSRDLNNLFSTVHAIIGDLMYANNFFIALYDAEHDKLSFPYWVDEIDTPPNEGTAGRGLTAYVLRHGKSLLCDQKLSDELESQGEAELVGVPSPIWLGVPLIVEGKTIGAMVVQHYSDPTVYTERELHILEFVSSQVAKSIERKQAQTALKESEDRYRAFVTQSTEGIWRYESTEPISIKLTPSEQVNLFLKTAFIAECNDAMAQMYGFLKSEEFIGTKLSNMLDPTDTRNTDMLKLFIECGYRLTGAESREIDKFGNAKIFLNNFVGVVENGLFKGVWGTQTDISERRHAEELIIHSEEKYRTLFEESQDAILLTTPDGTLLDINQAGIDLFGYSSRDEMLKLKDADILYFNPDDRDLFIGRLEQYKFVKDLEVTIRRKDGEKRFVLENASAVFNNEGNVTAYRSFLRDITERKYLEDQLRQAQKMESIGTLAGGIAHDFNNILGIILGYTSLLQKGTTDQQRVSQNLETIKRAVQRGADLVRQLLTFAHKGEPELSSVNINDIVTELVKILNQTFPKTIRIESKLYHQPPFVIADSSQLHLALLNLCVNARDAMLENERGIGDEGVLILRTDVVALENIIQKYPKAKAKHYISISVTDNGIGMDDETRNRIFEPFFTTKELGKGTGLGLAVVYGVINSHQGIVEVESTKGVGTTFTLYIPAVESEINDNNQPTSEEPITPMGNETILIVEDEEMLAILLSSIISDQGYNVLIAKDGQEGIQIYKDNLGKIDLVVSDMGLPKLGGYEMFMKMKEVDENVTAILASGYFDLNLKKELLSAGAKDFIQKPYVPELILERIREVLDEKKKKN
ncbi:MAG: PAS domain S-box protein [Ignavibacteriales bacterium]|nr:PAS domain S-box protein [Ignavibacteriales bacterium]